MTRQIEVDSRRVIEAKKRFENSAAQIENSFGAGSHVLVPPPVSAAADASQAVTSSSGLQPTFALSAVHPRWSGADSTSPDEPYMDATIQAFGMFTSTGAPGRLADQFAADEFIIGGAVEDHPDQDLTDLEEITKQSSLFLSIDPNGYEGNYQLLIVVGTRQTTRSSEPRLQVFFGLDWIQTAILNYEDSTDNLGLLVDVTNPNNPLWIVMRLADASSSTSLAFTGLTGYVL